MTFSAERPPPGKPDRGKRNREGANLEEAIQEVLRHMGGESFVCFHWRPSEAVFWHARKQMVAELAREFGVTERHVIRHVDRLRGRGAIDRVKFGRDAWYALPSGRPPPTSPPAKAPSIPVSRWPKPPGIGGGVRVNNESIWCSSCSTLFRASKRQWFQMGKHAVATGHHNFRNKKRAGLGIGSYVSRARKPKY